VSHYSPQYASTSLSFFLSAGSEASWIVDTQIKNSNFVIDFSAHCTIISIFFFSFKTLYKDGLLFFVGEDKSNGSVSGADYAKIYIKDGRVSTTFLCDGSFQYFILLYKLSSTPLFSYDLSVVGLKQPG